MNIAESIKHVLKNKSQDIFSDIWREDVRKILRDVGEDFSDLLKSGSSSVKNLKAKDIKINFKELVDSSADALLIFKVLPKRIKQAFLHFKEDLYEEMEKQPDTKHKTIFGLKVFGALTSFTVASVYSVKMGKGDFKIAGLKSRNAFTQFIIAEIIFRLSQLFIQKFLNEVEKNVSDPEELKNLRYFKKLISNRSKMEAHGKLGDHAAGDKSIEIVEKLKTYIMTGKRT